MKKTILEGVFPQAGKPQTDGRLPETDKAPYETPKTTRTLVETEGSFCGSIVPDEPSSEDVSVSSHKVDYSHYEEDADGTLKNPFDYSDTDTWD